MEKGSNYRLRKVTHNDCKLVFDWANDETVRKSSFNVEPIKYENHIEWFRKIMESSDSFMYIFEVAEVEVGIIRLDRINEYAYLINYSVAKEHRGKGYATLLLQLVKDTYNGSLLVGKVKSTNIGSLKAFIKAGYFEESQDDIKVFYSLDRRHFEGRS